MRSSWLGTAAWMLLAALAAPPAAAQKATEQYIPIGRSPGLGPEDLAFGEIQVLDPIRRRLVVAGQEIGVDDSTRVYLDRSSQGLVSLEADLAACRPGLTAEVRLEPAETGGRPTADWIKLRIESPDPPR